jgi:hypothetical protein
MPTRLAFRGSRALVFAKEPLQMTKTSTCANRHTAWEFHGAFNAWPNIRENSAARLRGPTKRVVDINDLGGFPASREPLMFV